MACLCRCLFWESLQEALWLLMSKGTEAGREWEDRRAGQEAETQSTCAPGVDVTFQSWWGLILKIMFWRSRVIIFSLIKDTEFPQESASEGLGWDTECICVALKLYCCHRATCNPGPWDLRLPNTAQVLCRSHQATYMRSSLHLRKTSSGGSGNSCRGKCGYKQF